ncbi:MAG TPA: tRNA preQ1(34) S-adenosylmethionine ribosyltransferase-isomerase QueA [Kofleriaceae bacterium]|nr:tRNA preQ1(34) S-adenosylmethionine ribosyltransferase-isomerase QueA [Kofleriaceae bacterium]
MDRRHDYDFELPPAQIAQHPAARRDGARLLWLPPDGPAEGVERTILDLPELLPAGAVVIVNDTRVIPARVRGRKASGGAVELLFLEPTAAPSTWRCWARARRPLRAGQVLHTAGGAAITLASDRADDGSILATVDGDVHAFLDAHGELPLPPYLERAGGLSADDRERYQTVYARAPGAIAAPTAGLHLTPELLAALAARGLTVGAVTLHVGLGTFAPVREDDLARHVMHVERFTIPEATAALVASGRPVVAIGTTVVRALESAATGDHRVAAGPGETGLFIRPGTGFRFRVVDHLLTNFHLPQSTLLMLVCTFAGKERVLAAYRHAVASGFRFFSYGDAMLLTRAAPP